MYVVVSKIKGNVMITCEKQWWLGETHTCGATLRVPSVTNVSWKLEESNREIQLTHVLIWLTCASLEAPKETSYSTI